MILVMCGGALWGLWQILVPKPAVADNAPPVVNISADANDPRPSFLEADAAPDAADGPYRRRDDCWTFLLVGMDRGGGNTDSLMLVTYDVANQSVSVGSIARDTRVDVDRKLKKINAAYALSGKKMDGLIEEVSKTFGVPVDYYFRVNVNGFVRLVNAVDGIDFNIPCYMDYDDPEQDLSIHYSKGTRHLNGQQALEVCRFRQNNDGSGYGDEGRQQTQRGVLTAVVKKALSHPEKLSDYVSIAEENLDTNLSVSNLAWFAAKALSFDTENLHLMSMPCEWINPYMYLDPDETLAMVNEYFNPYTTPRTADMLDIVTRSK
ncbi:MAG: LCP family protein [Oscillospiraceae bacterium]|nr:LCP family protein [Oscillospiraceae bacterium]